MKQQQKLQDNEIDIEKIGSISYFWKKVKNSIFDVLFIILDNKEEEGGSLIGLCLQSGVDYIQMFAFPFSDNVINVWNANQTLEFFNFSSIFNIFSYIPGISFKSYMVGLYALVLLIIFVMCDVVYVAYSFSQKRFKFTWPLILLAKIVPLIVTVLFQPIMQTLLNIVNCNSVQGQNYQILQQFSEVVCWQGWHTFHAAIILIFSFFFVVISCIVTLALFQPRMTSNRLTARQNSTGQVIFVINKIVCQFIFSFSPFSTSLPYCILLFGLSGWLFYSYNFHPPYYDKRASKFYIILSSYFFWTNTMLLISQIFTSYGFQDGFVLWICGMVFIGITLLVSRQSSIDKILTSNLKFKSGEQLQSHLQYVLLLHHNRNLDKNSYMLLLGYIEKHIQLCLEEDCPLKSNKTKFTSGKQQQQYFCKQLLKQLQRMFLTGLKKYPQCTKLRLTFAFFFMEQYECNIKAYQNFTKALNTDPSFGEQFIIYRFRKIIGQNLQQNKQEQQTDLIQLIRFDNHVSLCQQNMLLSGKLHKQFWLQLKQESPNLDRLNSIGARIIQTNQIIKDNYKQIVRLSHDGESILHLQYNYSLFQLFISHETQQGMKLLETVHRKYQKSKYRADKHNQKNVKLNRMQQIMSRQTGLIVSEVDFDHNEKQPCCIIKQVNQQFIQLTKYREEELIDQRLQLILPKIYEEDHDAKIRQWFENQQSQPQGEQLKINANDNVRESNRAQLVVSFKSDTCKQTYVGTKRIGYIRQSSGFIRRVCYQVHFLTLQFKFVTEVRLQPYSNQNCYIICNTQGIVMQMCATTLYKFPKIRECLQIQTIIGLQFIQTVNISSEKSTSFCYMSQSKSNANKRKVFQCLATKIQLIHKQSDESKDQNMIQQLKNYKKIKGIIVSIFEHERARLPNKASKMKLTKSIKRLSNQKLSRQGIQYERQRKKSIVMHGITSSIQKFYNKILTFEERQNLEIDIRTSYNKQIENMFKVNYAIYYKQEDDKQHLIKVYRYFDGTLQRIYYDQEQQQSDYDFEQKLTDLQAKLSKEKIKQQGYQKKIKQSINTFIYHPQIINLFWIGLLLFLIAYALHFLSFIYFNNTINSIISNIQQVQKNLQDVLMITSSLSQTLFQSSMSQTSYNQLNKYTIQFQNIYPNINNTISNFLKEDFTYIDIELVNSLLLVQTSLLKFNQYQLINNFKLSTQKIQTIYFSYFQNMQQIITNNFPIFQQNSNLFSNYCIIYTVLMFIITFIFVIIWIYESLTIKYKIFSILLWFLDIPFQYINFAEAQCLRFTRNYFKEQKNQQNSEQQIQDIDYLMVQQYQQRNSTKEQKQLNQNIEQNYGCKSRQIIISKYKNKKLLSRFTKSQLMKFSLFIVTMTLLVVLLTFQKNIQNETFLIQKSMNSFTQQYIWTESLPIIIKIIQQKTQNNSQWNLFTLSRLKQLKESINIKIINSTKKQVKQLRQNMMRSLISNYPQFVNDYLFFQYSDLCLKNEEQTLNYTLNDSIKNMQQCDDLIRGRLKGGYSVVQQYIKTSINFVSKQQIQQLQRGLRTYAYPQMFQFIQKLSSSASQNVNSKGIKIGITFYFFMIFIFGLLLPWNLYLRRTNIKANQTIQILNIIPLKLIPVSKKQTRQFLKWIIFKANQQKQIS